MITLISVITGSRTLRNSALVGISPELAQYDAGLTFSTLAVLAQRWLHCADASSGVDWQALLKQMTQKMAAA